MQCIIPNQNVRILVRGLHSLSRIGDELYVEPTKNGISFRTVNSAQSAYSSLSFNLSFFSRFQCNFQSDEEGTCKISMRACLRMFKSPNCMDRNVESCKIEVGDECTKLIFQIQYNQGYTKTHFLSVNDNETVQLRYNKSEMKNVVSILPRTLHRAVKNFGQKVEEITFDVTEDKVNLKNYLDNSEENQKDVRTNFCLHRSDFETYNVSRPNSITFALRELRAVCTFSESSNSVIGMHFEMCGKPVIFTVENPLYKADYVVSTLPPEIISGERPYRRSQLSDIASSMPSTSVVNSSKKRRLAPVNEEIAEPIATPAIESNAEPNQNVQVVQVEVHQPQTCTPNFQQKHVHNNTAISTQVEQPIQNNATHVSQVKRNSQNNSINVTQKKHSTQKDTMNGVQVRGSSQNNTIYVVQDQRNNQNNTINVIREQRNSQNNITNVDQARHNSQNNVTNVAQISSRCSFGLSNESDTNLDELMMKIDMNTEYFQDTNQKTITDELTGVDESHVQKIEAVFQHCFNFPSFPPDSDSYKILREIDD